MRKPKPFTNLFGKRALTEASRTTPGGWGQKRIGTKPMAHGLKPRTKPVTPEPRTLGNINNG
jgi:hypothetical protein